MRPLIFAYLLAIAAAAIASPIAAYALLQPGLESDALCETDSDCMLHCPPPADDPDCDGGPDDGSSAWLKREQERLCAIDAVHCEEAR